jgi:hypothetical protein
MAERLDRAVPRSRPAPSILGLLALGVLVVVALASACSPDDGSTSGAGGGGEGGAEVADTPSGVSYLEDPSQVPRLIYDQFGEMPSFTQLIVSDDDLMIEVRDPDIPENLDQWRFRDGEWTSSPVSVTMAEIEQLDETTFGPEAIAWDLIPDLVQQAYDGVDLEEEQVDSVSFDRIAGDPPRIYIGVSGLRGTGRLLANADGTEVEVARN